MLHNDVHILFSFIGFPHLYNIWMRYKLDDLNLFPQKLLLPVCQLRFIYLLNSHHFLILTILALKHLGELTLAQLSTLNIFLVKTQIIGLLLDKLDPVENCFLVLVVELFGLDDLVLVGDDEAIVVGALVTTDLCDIKTS